MRIANNLMSLNIMNKQKTNQSDMSKSMEKLSSGLRINRASDDAAGLSISQKMRAQIRGLNMAQRNAQDGISLLQTADGALGEMTDIGQRMRELCVQGANGTLTSEDREKVQMELDQLKSQLHTIASDTEFNTRKLLDGSIGLMGAAQTVSVDIMPNLAVPSDGSTVSQTITAGNLQLDVKFTKSITGDVTVDVQNQGISIGTTVVPKVIDTSAIEWQKSLGGTGYDQVYFVRKTSDGGYLVGGRSESSDGDVTGNHGGDDIWVAKLGADGSQQWEKSFGGSLYDVAWDAQETADGGYILAGHTASTDGDIAGVHGGADGCIIKIDGTGNLQWEKTVGGTGEDRLLNLKQTADGGYITVGSTESHDGDVSGNHGLTDVWLTKLDSSGNLLWTKCLGGSADEGGYSIQTTTDGGYIISGASGSSNGDVSGNHGPSDAWVIKTDSFGNIQWQKSFGGSGDEWGGSIQQTTDGGYIVAGYSGSADGDVTVNHGSFDGWLTKLDASGNLQWQRSYGGSLVDMFSNVKQTPDGGYIVSGITASSDGDVSTNHGPSDAWVVQVDSMGNLLWEKTFGGTGGEDAYSIESTADGGFIFAGSSNSNDGDVSGNHGSSDYWVVKYSSVTSSGTVAKSLVLPDVQVSNQTYQLQNGSVTFHNGSLSQVDRITLDVRSGISGSGLSLQVGANAGQTMTISVDDMRPEALGMSGNLPCVNPIEMAGVSLSITDAAIQKLSSQRSYLGAKNNALEHIIRNVDNTAENLTAAESRISDVDMAKEITQKSKLDVLAQASIAMLSQSNQAPQAVLQLLK